MAYEHATAWRAVRPSPTAHTAPSIPDAGCMAPGKPSEEVIAFARRHGLNRLDGSHLARMRELMPLVARFEAEFRQRRDKRQAPMLHTRAHGGEPRARSEEHQYEHQSLMRISHPVFCLQK